MKKILQKIGNFLTTLRQHRNEPLHIEFILSDYCNLNCKGCTHFSPLAAKEFTPLEQLERSATRLGAALDGRLDSVYIIGGEPLLYPGLEDVMRMMRRAFPTTKILIFTNGICLPKMSADFWSAARECGIEIAITRYPIAFDYDAAEARCAAESVKCTVFGDRGAEGSFFRFALDPAKKQNGRLSHFKCFNRGCISVVGDRIYPCSISACVSHLNRAAGTRFEHRKGDSIAVAEVTDVEQLRRFRDRPVPFCGYCKPRPTITPYGISKKDKAEWVDLSEEPGVIKFYKLNINQ